ncbi:SH3 domain-containing protein [bacterium]|nr:SH3 domain-containing protein [bacterium]
MKRYTIVLFLLVILSMPALADSGSYWSDFSNPQPFKPGEDEIEHPDVVMADEYVTITLDQGGAWVDANFTFRNEGAAQTVPMYFPLESSRGWSLISEEEYSGESEVTTVDEITNSEYSFSASIQELELKERIIRETTLRVNQETLEELGAYEASIHFDTYALYEVPFDAGETLWLSVRYWQKYSVPKHATWVEMFYPVYTGGSWQGPIGHGIIEINSWGSFDWNGRWQFRSIGLPPAREERNKDNVRFGSLFWEFTNLEPERGAGVEVLMIGHSEPWGNVLATGGINFRTLPEPAAARVSAHPVMKEGELFTIFGRQGDWWRVEDEEGNIGWLRWRYVDPDTGKESIYATFTNLYAGA